MFLALNGVPITPSWSGGASLPQSGQWFRAPFRKLDAFVNGTDAVYQILEEPAGWQEDQAAEGLLRMGFNSVEHLTPFVAIRFRVWTNTLLAQSGTVDIKLFG